MCIIANWLKHYDSLSGVGIYEQFELSFISYTSNSFIFADTKKQQKHVWWMPVALHNGAWPSKICERPRYSCYRSLGCPVSDLLSDWESSCSHPVKKSSFVGALNWDIWGIRKDWPFISRWLQKLSRSNNLLLGGYLGYKQTLQSMYKYWVLLL